MSVNFIETRLKTGVLHNVAYKVPKGVFFWQFIKFT
jgi:hypothetical protein